jgi:hypothetical protein
VCGPGDRVEVCDRAQRIGERIERPVVVRQPDIRGRDPVATFEVGERACDLHDAIDAARAEPVTRGHDGRECGLARGIERAGLAQHAHRHLGIRAQAVPRESMSLASARFDHAHTDGRR